jgi:hypothetical protein
MSNFDHDETLAARIFSNMSDAQTLAFEMGTNMLKALTDVKKHNQGNHKSK